MRRLIVIGVLALSACAHKTPAEGAKVDPALATLVPPDTTLLLGTRVEALVKTPVYQKYLAGRTLPQIDEFAAKTGLDPRKDLWELLFASNGHQGILLGRGKFPDEIELKLQKQGAKRTVYKGYNLIGDDRAAVLFVSASTAAMGEPAALRSLIDQRDKSKGPPAALTALLNQIPPESQIWAVYSGLSINLDLPGNLANVSKILGYVQSGFMSFDLSHGLSGVATGDCTSEEGAQQVHDALKALIGLGRLRLKPDQTELQRAYDGIRVTLDSRRVKLYAEIPQDSVDKFLGMLPGLK